jgi:hypothetical protein
MKKYKRCPGVELLEICEEYLLVATKEARGQCSYVTQINRSAATCWKNLDGVYSVNELIERMSRTESVEKKNLLLPVLAFIEKFSKNGYLIEEDT